MPMYDYCLNFANSLIAETDTIMVSENFYSNNSWDSNRVIINLQVWQPSQDTINQIINQLPPPDTISVTNHNYLNGFYILIGISGEVPDSNLSIHPNLQFCLNRDSLSANQSFVVINNIGTTISDISFSPAFSSLISYPIGGYT